MDNQKLPVGTTVRVRGLEALGEVLESTCSCTPCQEGKYVRVRIGESDTIQLSKDVAVCPVYQDTDYGDDT